MKASRSLPLITILFFLVIPIRINQDSSPPLLVNDNQTFIFEDDFETESEWLLFEETPNSCFGTGIGSISRIDDVSYEGAYSFLVWANSSRSLFSNHLIAYKKVVDNGQMGKWLYSVNAYIDPTTSDTGQTGPEFMMQNTRETSPGEYETYKAAVQYIANPYDPNYQKWFVRAEMNDGGEQWIEFAYHPITAGNWQTLYLIADLSTNRYIEFSIDELGLTTTFDLSPHEIAVTEKFSEESFVITLEAENLWNNCGTAGTYDYRVYYDDIHVEKTADRLYLPLILR